MKSNRYNVILMRDDTSVKSFRLSPFWIKFLFFLFPLFIIISIMGIFFSYYFFQEKRELVCLYDSKTKSFYEMKKELERLQNVEKMLESYNEHQLGSFLISQQQPKHRQDKKDSFPAVDLRRILDPVDMNIVGVSNVQASFIHDRMRVQLDVNNMAGRGTVTGRITISLITNDARIIGLNLEDMDLNYAIARFRTIDNTIDLPQGLEQESIFALRISADDEDGNTVYSKIFPISSILI